MGLHAPQNNQRKSGAASAVQAGWGDKLCDTIDYNFAIRDYTLTRTPVPSNRGAVPKKNPAVSGGAKVDTGENTRTKSSDTRIVGLFATFLYPHRYHKGEDEEVNFSMPSALLRICWKEPSFGRKKPNIHQSCVRSTILTASEVYFLALRLSLLIL